MSVSQEHIEKYSEFAKEIENRLLSESNPFVDATFSANFCKFVNEFPEGNSLTAIFTVVQTKPMYFVKVHGLIGRKMVDVIANGNANWDLEYLQYFFPRLTEITKHSKNSGEEKYNEAISTAEEWHSCSYLFKYLNPSISFQEFGNQTLLTFKEMIIEKKSFQINGEMKCVSYPRPGFLYQEGHLAGKEVCVSPSHFVKLTWQDDLKAKRSIQCLRLT